ncbi:MAG: hypothetical protein IJ305_02485 [Oscillospiraceae bacterium]|nr:hypothetical protein [Oscillospiraceae bacterium]
MGLFSKEACVFCGTEVGMLFRPRNIYATSARERQIPLQEWITPQRAMHSV